MIEIKIEIEPEKLSPLEIVNKIQEWLHKAKVQEEIRAYSICIPQGSPEITEIFTVLHTEEPTEPEEPATTKEGED